MTREIPCSATFGSNISVPQSRHAAGNVTIFGAGIAGLTAAHELAERGFQVVVVEPEASGHGALQVGGMARSQIAVGEPHRFGNRAVMPWTTSNASPTGGAIEAHSRRAQSILFQWGQPEFGDPDSALGAAVEMARELVKSLSRRAADVAEGADEDASHSTILRVTGMWLGAESTTTSSGTSLGMERAQRTRDRLRPLVEERLELELRRLKAETDERTAELAAAKAPEARDKLQRTIRALTRRVELLAEINPERLFELRARMGDDPSDCRALVQLAWRDEVELPGEHGYRFFPSFYRHLFDTMKRTTLYEDGVETHRSALDNLRPTSSQIFAGALTSATLTRRRPRSLEALRAEVTKLMRELRFDLSDIAKFQAKVFRYMTTSSARRAAEYENISWWDFLVKGGVSYGEGFERFLKCAPQALVAMDAETCDARTQGNIVIQLLLDHLLDSEYTDATLNGPTSEAWLDPWRQHLGHLGVTFISGRLVEFQVHDSSLELFGARENAVPVVELRLPGQAGDQRTPLGCWHDQIVNSDYFVVATDVGTAEIVTNELARRSQFQVLPGVPRRVGGVPVELREYVSYVMSKTDMRIKTGLDADWDRLQRERLAVAGFPAEYWGHIRHRDELPAWNNYAEGQDLRTGRHRAKSNEQYTFGLTRHDRFQTFSGVQYYFAHDLEQARGHVYYFDTEWGLSSISPMQFWQHKVALRRKGVLGLLSVDIGNFRSRSSFLGKAAHECSKEELAHEVWRQISESLRRTRRAKAQETQRLPLPRPIYFHVDEFLRPGQPVTSFNPAPPVSTGSLCTTLTPFLVNNVGDWSNRPGSDPWDPEVESLPIDLVDEPNVWQADHGGYQVHYHKIVFAGTYMRTFTRMTTMEAANESARHAVNAILDHIASVRTVAQREAASRYGDWVVQEVTRNGQSPTSRPIEELIREVQRKVQLPLPLQTIAGEHCKIWNLERLELDDLAFLKRVDEALFKKGLPHMADIIDLDGLAANVSPDPSGFEGMLSSLLTTAKKDWAIDDEGVLRAAKGAGALVERLKEGLTRLTQELGRGRSQ